LHSRTVDIHIGDEDKKSEGIPPEASVSHDRREEFQAPASENGIGSHLISTPLISSSRVIKTAQTLFMVYVI
jgi:hypothetical protein